MIFMCDDDFYVNAPDLKLLKGPWEFVNKGIWSTMAIFVKTQIMVEIHLGILMLNRNRSSGML